MLSFLHHAAASASDPTRTPGFSSYALSALIVAATFALGKLWLRGKRWHAPLVLLAVLAHLRYISWRGLHTLSFGDPFTFAASALLFAAELYGFVTIGLMYLQAFWPVSRTPVPFYDHETPTVDIFIPIYNEPADILFRTLAAASELEYPANKRKIYVLDDGHRDEVRALADRFGCSYITRDDNRHAKAGNINNALTRTDGEIIALFDCDHVPVRTFLRETVGFFKEPDVAIVQTPHNFYNPDSFQRAIAAGHSLENEQELFYRVLMPGRDRANAAFFAGSSGLIRRKALSEIGGFRTESVIEDLYTSMELHSRGWRSVYLEKPLVGALSAESFASHLGQRKRWTRGGVQVFVKDNPLFKPGLSVLQSLHYLASLLYFYHGLARIVYLLAPLPVLFFGMRVINAHTPEIVSYFASYYIAYQTVFSLLTRRHRNPLWSEVYETADCFALSRAALGALFRPDDIPFEVTPKGRAAQLASARSAWTPLKPHLITFILLALGCAAGFLRLHFGTIAPDAAFMSMAWATFNMLILGAAIAAGREWPHLRRHHRMRRKLECLLEFEGESAHGWTRDVSEGGAAYLIFHRKDPLPRDVRAALRCGCGQTVQLKGRVVWQKPEAAQRLSAGIHFDAFDEAAHLKLLRLLFSCPHAWTGEERPIRLFRHSARSMVAAFGRALTP